MVTMIDLVFMFILLPILIFSDSWKRLRRVGWEWAIFGFLAMSALGSLLNDFVFPQWFHQRNLFNNVVSRGIVLAGVMMFFNIYTKVEQPVLAGGMKWRLFRSVPAAFIAIVLFLSIGAKIGKLPQFDPSLYGWLFILGAVLFISTQVSTYVYRDKERMAAYQKEQEKKKQLKTGAISNAAPPPAGEQPGICPHCGVTYLPSDYDSEAAVWNCSQCKNPLPKN